MINDNQNDDLIHTIRQLEEQNEQLINENKNLHNQIEALAYLKDNNNSTSILEYYLNIYLDFYNTLTEKRLSKVKIKIEKLQNEYQNLSKKENLNNETIKKHQEIINKIASLKEQNQSYYMELEEKRFLCNMNIQKTKEYEKRIEIITNECYQNILNNTLNTQDNERIQQTLSSISTTIYHNLLPQISQLSIQKEQDKLSFNEVNELEKRFNYLININKQEQKQLEEQMQHFSQDTVELIGDVIIEDLKKHQKLEEELYQLFKSIKQKDLKKISDQIRHYQVHGYSTTQIATIMDEEMEQFREMLENVDTVSNIKSQKIIKLSELNAQKTLLDQFQDERNQVVLDYEHLQNIFTKVNKDIEIVENYINKTTQVIEVNPIYQSLYNKYNNLEDEKLIYEQAIKDSEQQLNKVVTLRKSKVLDPYALDLVNEYNAKIKDYENKINDLKGQYQSCLDNIENLFESKESVKLINLFKDQRLCIQRLPIIYNKQHELTLIIDEKYQLLQTLNDKLINYEQVVKEIRDLENEIDH